MKQQGQMAKSFYKFCRYTILVMQLPDKHAYNTMCGEWNKSGKKLILPKEIFHAIKNEVWSNRAKLPAEEMATETVEEFR